MFDVLDGQWLRAQFDAARVAAMHVDLEELFETNPGDRYRSSVGLFALVNDFANAFRVKGVENYWAASGLNNRLVTYKEFKQNKRQGLSALHPDLQVPDDELVATNTLGSVFKNRKLTESLSEKGQATVIMTGIMFDACFFVSVQGAVSKGFNVLACLDATDCLLMDREPFTSKLRKGLNSEQQGRLMITNTEDVLGVF